MIHGARDDVAAFRDMFEVTRLLEKIVNMISRLEICPRKTFAETIRHKWYHKWIRSKDQKKLVNPGFGGLNPGFGGLNPGFGGLNPGFGGYGLIGQNLEGSLGKRSPNHHLSHHFHP